MKLRINRHELVQGMAFISTVAVTRSPQPILQCVLLRADADCVTLEATDLETGMHYVITQVEVESEGALLLPADKLAAIAKESVEMALGAGKHVGVREHHTLGPTCGARCVKDGSQISFNACFD